MAQNQAVVPCFQRDALVGFLADQYAEALVAGGISNSGLLLEVYVSQAGTWTITAMIPTGQVCMVANGFEWRTVGEHDGETDPQ